jgi:uncharacterized protein YecE (DUF72 family)
MGRTRKRGGSTRSRGSGTITSISREEIQQIGEKLKTATGQPGVRQTFAFFNNHVRANAAVNAIMLAQELNLPLRSMPSEAMLARFPALAKGVRPPVP